MKRTLSILILMAAFAIASTNAQDKMEKKDEMKMEKKSEMMDKKMEKKMMKHDGMMKEEKMDKDEMGKMKSYMCSEDCGFMVQSPDEEEVMSATKMHGKKHHNLEMTDEMVKEKMGGDMMKGKMMHKEKRMHKDDMMKKDGMKK